jgi:UDP-2,3-diacylglucosamine pyrophosphatase LpxH
MQHSKGLAKLGAVGYDLLILLNRVVNFVSERVFRKGKISLSKKIKNSVKSALKFINDFEETAAQIGISNNYQYVICGHIHQPQSRIIETSKGSIHYLNSGDWIENLTSLEYVNGHWTVYHFDKTLMQEEEKEEEEEMDTAKLFDSLLIELTVGPVA